jgi:CheY-like chemotaxis protein
MNHSKRIMLIDDDPDDQLLFSDAIQTIQPGFHCELASSCKEAFKQLESPPPPELIFMDLNMPVMNGFDCLIYLKSQTRYKHIPVVIFTTSKNIKDIDRTRELGAKWYLTKPDDFNVLCWKLNSILQKEVNVELYTI